MKRKAMTMTKQKRKQLSPIDSYVRSKGTDTPLVGHLGVLACIEDEYGHLLPELLNIKSAKMRTYPITDLSRQLILNHKYLDQINPREPIGDPPVCGILLERSNIFRLVDGYHRYKWALENGEDAANFIVLYPGTE